MSEVFVSVAVISGIFGGLAGLCTAAVQVIKALFGKNENKALEYKHQEKIIELMGAQAQTSDRTLAAIEGLRDDVGSLRNELGGLNKRVLKLEEAKLNETK